MSHFTPSSEEDDRVELPAPTVEISSNPLRTAWHHWKSLAHSIGVVQTRFLMVLFYFAVAVPTGLLMRTSGDRLRLQSPKDTCWVPHPQDEHSLETAHHQF